MLPIFAQTSPADGNTAYIAIGAIALLLSMGVSFFALVRAASGKASERQIEPTQLAALQAQLERNHAAAATELRAQTLLLNKLDRESGETKTAVNALGEEVGRLRTEEIQGMFKRINAISTESTQTKTRVDGLEQREAHRSRNS